MDQEVEQLLWEFIDGSISAADREMVVRQLADNPAWKKKYTELTGIHEMLRSEEPEMPSVRFTKNVMEEIARYQVAPATKTYINQRVIRGLVFFFLTLLTGLFIFFIGQIHWISQPSNHFLPSVNLEAEKMNWTKILSGIPVNIFMGINVILALILIDRYMQGRKQTGQTRGFTGDDSA